MHPTILLDTLQSVRRRVKLLGLAFGVGVLLSAAVGAALLTFLADYLLNLHPVPRLVLAFTAAGAIVYVGYRYLARPAAARLSLRDVAGHLEAAFPQFDDRLRSTVDFLQAEVPGSPVMQQRVVREADELARRVNLRSAIVIKPVAWSVTAGLTAIALTALLTLVVPLEYRQIAMNRLLAPFSGADWPRKVQIALLSEVPERVPVGHRLDVRMKLERGDRQSMRAIVFYQYGDGPVHRELMGRTDSGEYAATIDAKASATGNLRIWMEAGDDRQAIAPITVVPRLAIRRVEARITPPPYVAEAAGQLASTVNLGSAPALATEGGLINLNIQFSKPVDPESLRIEPVGDDQPPPTPHAGDILPENQPAELTRTWEARHSLRFRIRAIDTDGFANIALEEYQIIVRPDQLPMVQIELPGRNEDRTPDAVVPLQAVAEDDFGIESIHLVVNRVRHQGMTVDRAEDDPPDWIIPLVEDGRPQAGASWQRIDGSTDRHRFRLNWNWELDQLADARLVPGDVLEFHLQVQDNFHLDDRRHPPVNSGVLRINVISHEELATRVTEELRMIANHIRDVRNTQERTREETANLARDVAEKTELDDADRTAAERLANQQSRAASQTSQIARKLDEIEARLTENRSPNNELRDTAAEVSRQLNQAAEHPMKEAAADLNAAREQQADTEQPQEAAQQRSEHLDQAQANQQQASDQLQRALDRMGNIGSLQQSIERIRDILADQQQVGRDMRDFAREHLGQRPEDMNPEDRRSLEDLAGRQDDLARRTEEALAEMRNTAEQMQQSDPASAQAMQRASQTGQNQQVAPNQQQAAQQARQNQQAQAQSNQQQAELGLEMILAELREAERRKLEELARQLAEIEEQIRNLIRRQAGHNLDNLALQGPDSLAELDEQLLTHLLRMSQRQADQPQNPPLPQLSTAQAQTERNTRSVSQAAEALPQGAEPAARLLRAAGRMERAMVSLRGGDLAGAYQPPQVEALAALEEALRIIEQQRADAEDQLDRQQREAIREAYVRLKEDQEQLNTETGAIEDARNDQGELARGEQLRLNQLPARQGELADRAQALGEDLSALRSIVYLWANRDIVTTMNEIKDALGQSDTGPITRAEQARVVEQLEAMIRNLAIEPPEPDQFASRDPGGGGDGSSEPALPSEAELRLLKELQIAVNRTTKVLDLLPRPDRPRLVALGQRQGEFRNLLDELIQQASNGQLRLRDEPDNRDQLPEEAGHEAVENQELEEFLLNQEPQDQRIVSDILLVGDRMARSKQRLALNHDPGRVTQIIQERILEDLDELIQQARDQAQQQQQAQGGGQGQQRQQAQAQQDQPANEEAGGQAQQQQIGEQAAADSGTGPAGSDVRLSEDIRGAADDFMGLSDRLRDPVIEGADEAVIEKYRRLIEDYYRGVSTRAAER